VISVEPLGNDTAEWDHFVSRAPAATFCHLAPWRAVMSDVLKHECRYLIARSDAGAVEGVLPLVRVRSRLLGHYLISMPFLNYGGAVGSPAAREALMKRAVGDARRLGVDLLELRTREAAESDLQLVERKITVLLPLPDSADALWQAFPSKLRSQIRRPQKDGMTARFGPDQLEPFYEVFARNMRDLGTPVLPRAFFEGILQVLPEQVTFGAVYAGERPVAGGCGFVLRDEFELTWASSLREFNRSAPNMLLYWSLMQRAIEQGLGTFNFGRYITQECV